MNYLVNKCKEIVGNMRKNYKSAILNFIFIVGFITVFQTIFGAENSIVGVTLTILMSASMLRDMTAEPLKHLLLQAGVLMLMAISACLVNVLDPWLAVIINFGTAFIILYTFTYEHSTHMYFPYILSYLFFIFITPVSLLQLPKRLLSMAIGALCIIVYQLVMGRKRIVTTTRSVLDHMLSEIIACIEEMNTNEMDQTRSQRVRKELYDLSRLVYERRKKVLCISDSGIAMLNCGRGLEYLLLQIMDESLNENQLQLLKQQLNEFKEVINQENELSSQSMMIQNAAIDKNLQFIHQNLKAMNDPQNRSHYNQTSLSLIVRLKALFGYSEVRMNYALRVAFLIAVFTLLTQQLHLTYGKWLLFTLASVSLPYTDDIKPKARKRLIATLVGCVISVIAYTLLPASGARTGIMMASGFMSFFFADYVGTYAMSTIGALGGAVFLSYFTLADITQIALIRILYIVIGIVIAWLFNCVLFPYSRKKATAQLCEKYAQTTDLLSDLNTRENNDSQLYYGLMIQVHLLEEKIIQNAKAEGWNGIYEFLSEKHAQHVHAHQK